MKTVRVASIAACSVLLCITIVYFANRAAVSNGGANVEALEREIRIGLPLGSSLPTVQDFLAKRGAEFSFDPSSKSAHAIIRNLIGSTIAVSQSLTLRFHFDDSLKLKTLDAKLVYTGP
jgi:hypothetical protein